MHHLTYERLGAERDEDLLVVCRRCHKKEDKKRSEGRPPPRVLTDSTAEWRKQPASDRQLEILKKQRIPYGPSITKGEASDLYDQAKALRALKRRDEVEL